MHAEPQASHRDSLADVPVRMAKAEARAQVSASALREIAGRVIRKTHGKMLAAAEAVEVSESQIGRLVNDGDLKLKQLEALGPATLAELGRELVEQFGPLSTPQARMRQNLRDVQRLLSEVEQFLEMVS